VRSEDDVYNLINSYLSEHGSAISDDERIELWQTLRFFELSTAVLKEATRNQSIPEEWKGEIMFTTIARSRGEDVTDARFITMSPREMAHNKNPVFLVSRVAKGSEDMARRWGYNGQKIDALKLLVDKDVLLCSIGVYGSVRMQQPDYTTKLTVIKGDRTLVDAKEYRYSLASPTVHYLDLDEPLLLKPDDPVQIELTVNGNVSYAIGLGVSMVTVDGLTVKFLDADLAVGKVTNHTDISRGQFPAFKFQYPRKVR